MSKINQMLIEWVKGDLHSLKWMKKRGVPQNLAYLYYKKGSLDKIGPGIYKRKGESASWMGAVRLLQEELGKALHVSGRTALELKGASHYTPMGKTAKIYLASYEKAKLPKWLLENDFGCEFSYRSSKLFTRELELSEFTSPLGYNLKISSRELAVLELIDLLDLKDSFETAENYLNGLSGLRADKLQILLENCTSIKVKRVFLYLSEKIGHNYFHKLDTSKIELGKGKRQIVKTNSQLDKKYKITVPRDYGENPF
ncbi:type IV toxin-antitoxin system AbiEi family antitoxin domain-containing protein [Halobacteriovorax sp. HLS]|uniref:type IV toxin-antitoxin system AbiEi family antitoxin domain-containing protein n=1 Tax=Halobacteriovorax sp. HLS TaxID=2234000 RepID=UPI000FDAB205|nr:type IV toxin-antitoxin system AbiEi family antitoxin domain-containing protein [Halobacteriovorax sp. HLS]